MAFQGNLLSKTLVIGVIVLFVSVGIQPAFANDNNIISIEKQQLRNKSSINTNPIFSRSVTFMKTFGGTGPDLGECVQQISDGGLLGEHGFDLRLF